MSRKNLLEISVARKIMLKETGGGGERGREGEVAGSGGWGHGIQGKPCSRILGYLRHGTLSLAPMSRYLLHRGGWGIKRKELNSKNVKPSSK